MPERTRSARNARECPGVGRAVYRLHVTQALYRRYRPDTFTEVIGQSHVTEPLQQALRADRVTHAYLFSGPRGCGKTTSARILARCLNCAEGPTDTPCGRCDSCVDLARGGSGSLDVVEIDAASHNGVDDARDLRERAAYAPARDRYKIFILDEAHMVTTQGFNALLKIVEEPPPHVKFIFATTEPDKVIGTIRSRTHHYPFRLVPPEILRGYLEQICLSEGVPVGPGVLPLVVRAGAGSVRDSLSVLDQLMAGARDTGLDYERAVALLGYTHAALLDDTVDALAARDGASVFRVVDRVISSGHEPRRFVEDLLERLRDLIVIAASGDAAEAVLRDIPADQLVRMRTQAGHLGIGELSRAADLVNAALSEMTGATSPRLHLELLCARLLLPAADDGSTGHGARLDRLERQMSGVAGVELGSAPAAARPAVAPAAPSRPVVAAPAVPARSAAPPAPVPIRSAASATPAPVAAAPRPDAAPPAVSDLDEFRPPADPADDGVPATIIGEVTVPVAASVLVGAPVPVAAPAEAAARVDAPALVDAPAPALSADPVATPPSANEPTGAALETELLRRRWPEVLETISGLRKVTRALVDQQNARVAGLTADTLRLSFTTAALATTFRAGHHAEVVQRAVRETLGFDVRVEGHLEEGSTDPVRPTRDAAPVASAPARRAKDQGVEAPAPAEERAEPPVAESSASKVVASPVASPVARPAAVSDWPEVATPGGRQAADSGANPVRPAAPAPAPPPSDGRGERGGSTTNRGPRGGASGGRAARPSSAPRPASAARGPRRPADEEPDLDPGDAPIVEGSGLVGAPLVAQLLGGTVIDEVIDRPS